ncbi:hypothetical protein [Hydrogenophaga palleronii]|uniref:hypothetical protein n=1 Tax=Hydrogenophaga palleronii TaxID=65655 RepID=UPI0012EE0B01|nr:hypothetical protein [Hydrogenophaga palleronii]
MTLSVMALCTSLFAAYLQYQSRQDTIAEQVKIELKMTLEESPLNSLDLRMISGVEERRMLEPAILLTNTGATNVRIIETGFHDMNLPVHAFYAKPDESRLIAPGEQAIFKIPDLLKVENQLTSNVRIGESKTAKIFAVSTKGSRFEAPAIIEVSQ